MINNWPPHPDVYEPLGSWAGRTGSGGKPGGLGLMPAPMGE